MISCERVVGRTLAVVVVGAMVAASCSSGSSHRAHGSHGSSPTAASVGTAHRNATRTVTVRPVSLVAGSSGGAVVTRVDVTMAPPKSPGVDVAIVGAPSAAAKVAWTAAAWDAVIAATTRNGTPCRPARFTFRVSGAGDGTSAGALLAVAVLALLRGDALNSHVSIAGAVEPDGAVPPVAGLGARVAAARAAGIAEYAVADFADRYQSFTGHALPVAAATNHTATAPAPADTASLQSLVHVDLARVASDLDAIARLPAAVRNGLAPITAQARAGAARATALQQAGSLPGAFRSAAAAADTSVAAARTGSLVAGTLPRGIDAFSAVVHTDAAAVRDAVQQHLHALDAIRPTTLNGASLVLAAYGLTADASTLASYGEQQLDALGALPITSPRSRVVQLALGGAFFVEFSQAILDDGSGVIGLRRGDTGARIGTSADARALATCFGNAADANLAEFEQAVVEPATTGTRNASAVRSALVAQDLDYLLATATPSTDSAPYATLGANVARFVRSVGLLDAYTVFHAQRDSNGVVIGVASDADLATAIAHASAQDAHVLGSLAAVDTAPVMESGAFQSATSSQAGSVADRMTALAQYRSAFVGGAVLVALR